VIDGSTGSVVREPALAAFAKELSVYLSDPALTAQRGRNAREHAVRNYSRTRHMAILHELIARAAAGLRRERTIDPHAPASVVEAADLPGTSR